MPAIKTPSSLGTLAILCGGRSSRLGSDKGLYVPQGQPMPLVARMIERLGERFDEVVVVTRDNLQAAAYESALAPRFGDRAPMVRVVHDLEAFRDDTPRAALVGLVTALAAARQARVTVLPVDQLGVDSRHLERLHGELTSDEARGGAPAAIAYSISGDLPLPFPSVWPAERADFVRRHVAGGELSVRRLLVEADATLVDAGPDLAALAVNGNTTGEINDYLVRVAIDPHQTEVDL